MDRQDVLLPPPLILTDNLRVLQAFVLLLQQTAVAQMGPRNSMPFITQTYANVPGVFFMPPFDILCWYLACSFVCRSFHAEPEIIDMFKLP